MSSAGENPCGFCGEAGPESSNHELVCQTIKFSVIHEIQLTSVFQVCVHPYMCPILSLLLSSCHLWSSGWLPCGSVLWPELNGGILVESLSDPTQALDQD